MVKERKKRKQQQLARETSGGGGTTPGEGAAADAIGVRVPQAPQAISVHIPPPRHRWLGPASHDGDFDLKIPGHHATTVLPQRSLRLAGAPAARDVGSGLGSSESVKRTRRAPAVCWVPMGLRRRRLLHSKKTRCSRTGRHTSRPLALESTDASATPSSLVPGHYFHSNFLLVCELHVCIHGLNEERTTAAIVADILESMRLLHPHLQRCIGSKELTCDGHRQGCIKGIERCTYHCSSPKAIRW
ncbi:unnamed protein product [Urochloa humidicola]